MVQLMLFFKVMIVVKKKEKFLNKRLKLHLK